MNQNPQTILRKKLHYWPYLDSAWFDIPQLDLAVSVGRHDPSGRWEEGGRLNRAVMHDGGHVKLPCQPWVHPVEVKPELNVSNHQFEYIAKLESILRTCLAFPELLLLPSFARKNRGVLPMRVEQHPLVSWTSWQDHRWCERKPRNHQGPQCTPHPRNKTNINSSNTIAGNSFFLDTTAPSAVTEKTQLWMLFTGVAGPSRGTSEASEGGRPKAGRPESRGGPEGRSCTPVNKHSNSWVFAAPHKEV